jgi:hypothetical protein
MLNDGGGLYLFVSKGGSKLWRFMYTFDKKQKKLALGIYPDVTLEAARRKSEDAKDSVANGIDPSEIRSELKKARQLVQSNNDRITGGLPIINSFADIAWQWLGSMEHLTNPITQLKKTSRLERLAFPMLGDIAINTIKSSDILATRKPLIDKKQLSTVHRLHGEISAIFAYVIVHDFTDYDLAQPVARRMPAQKIKHRAAIIDPNLVVRLFRDIGNYRGTFVVK